MSSASDEEPYPLSWGESPTLQAFFALHAWNLEHSPVMAHWTAAGLATSLGCVLAAGRGAFVAFLHPPGNRLTTFIRASRSIAPLYIIPFVLGAQLDCYEASWERQGRKRTGEWSGAAASLG